ncbi:hypothetical protein CWC30_00990 [Pseudoalteromonas sp. S4741]|nr:hypothetical protein CWC30_00990 [Pseudoalteromonas sp. S4741]
MLKSYTGYPVAIKALCFISLGLRMLRFPVFLSTLNFKLFKNLTLSFTRLTKWFACLAKRCLLCRLSGVSL